MKGFCQHIMTVPFPHELAMKTIFQILIFALGINMAGAQSNPESVLKRIAALSEALDDGGIAWLLAKARMQSWQAPPIPSPWHVEHVSTPEQKSVDIAAREFGKKLAEHLDGMSPKLRQLPADTPLHEETARMLELSEWCAATDGYGNLFLAQRSLDLGAVGVARLAANPDFPVKNIDNFLARLNPVWMDIETNQRVLNKDAGATVFMVSEREEMERTYGSGQRLLEEQRHPNLLAERQKTPQRWRLVETPAIKANLSFFAGVEFNQVRPATLVNLWNRNCHLLIINGLELQSVRNAKALVEFRRAIGEFSEKPVFTAEQLRDRERGAAESAKAGLKIVNMEDTYASPGAAAFALAWGNYLEKTYGSRGNAPANLHNLNAAAFQAYDEIKRGVFFDQDTANTKQYESLTKANP